MSNLFHYKARDRQGHSLAGAIQAENESAAAGYLRGKGYYVTQLKEQRKALMVPKWWQNCTAVSAKELAVLCRQFAAMMNAGVAMLTCLRILVEQTSHASLKRGLQNVYIKVQEGEPLSSAMQKQHPIFPSLMTSMLEAGEVGGVLDVILNRLAMHYENEHRLNEKIKSAMTYPAVVISMAMLSIGFILIFVMPAFSQLYQEMNMAMPLPTRMLLTIANGMDNHGTSLLVSLLPAGCGFVLFMKYVDTPKMTDRILLSLPVFGIMRKKIMIARFSRTLGTLLRGGVPLLAALAVVGKSIGSSSILFALAKAQANVKAGRGLAVALKPFPVFPPMVIQLVAIGEETGELDIMLEKIADFYEADVEDIIGRLSSILEPLLIGVLGVIIGLMIIAVVLPMVEAVSAVGKQ